MRKKIIILLTSAIIIIVCITKCCSYHEYIDYTAVKKIQCTSCLEGYKYFEYTNEEEIKRISLKIQHWNLYPATVESLYESPTASIHIVYDGYEKCISITGGMVLIQDVRNGEIIKRENYFYYTNPLNIETLF